MSNCLNPLKLFEIDKDTKKIYGKNVDHVEVSHDGTIRPAYTKSVSPFAYHAIFSYREIPCRTCYACRKSHARVWSERIMAELPYYDSSYFITLTYDDEHLPYNEPGMAVELPTLRTKDLQDFWKRLRDRLDYRIKYFACGEYGSSTYRPHYHAIVFGLKLDDLIEYSVDMNTHDVLFTSEFLSSVWQNGFVTIGEVTPASACYVAGYVDKKLDDNKFNKTIKQYDLEPERLYMSNGIGLRAFDDKIKDDLFTHNYSSSIIGSHEVHNNNYFMSKFKSSNPDAYQDFVDSLEEFEKADRRARRKLMPDSVYYDGLDQENEFRIRQRKRRGD